MENGFVLRHLIDNFDVIKAIGYTHTKQWDGYKLTDEDDAERIIVSLYKSVFNKMEKNLDTYSSTAGFRIGVQNGEAYLCFDRVKTIIHGSGYFDVEKCQVYYKFNPSTYLRSIKIQRIQEKVNLKKINHGI